jgi:hypothetical protein
MVRLIAVAAVAGCIAPAFAFTLHMRAPVRSPEEVVRPFKEGRALKVIAGITNFDRSLVTKVSRSR